MPNIMDVFPSRFLAAHELKGREWLLTIARVEMETLGRGPKAETLPVLYFKGKAKGVKLNKTMATELARFLGSPLTEAWVGKAVTLFASTAKFGTETYPVVRVKAPAAAQVERPRPVPVAATGTDGRAPRAPMSMRSEWS